MKQNYCFKLSFHPTQLHLQPRLSEQYLATIILDGEEVGDEKNKEELDISLEPQLDLSTNQITPDNHPFNIPTETLWEQTREKDKLTPSILKLLKDGS